MIPQGPAAVRPAATLDGAQPDSRRPLAVGAVLTAMTLVVLDAGMTNLALPTIAKALDVSPAAAVLVITAYQTALLVALCPPPPWVNGSAAAGFSQRGSGCSS